MTTLSNADLMADAPGDPVRIAQLRARARCETLTIPDDRGEPVEISAPDALLLLAVYHGLSGDRPRRYASLPLYAMLDFAGAMLEGGLVKMSFGPSST